MFPILSILIAFVLAFAYLQEMTADREPDLVAAGALVLGFALLARIVGSVAARRAVASGEEGAHHVARAGVSLRTAVLVVYAGLVFGFDWPALGFDLLAAGWLLPWMLLALLPFFLLQALALLASWSAESALDLHRFTRAGYLMFHLRVLLLPVVAMLFFTLLTDLVGFGSRMGVGWLAEFRIHSEAYPFVQWISGAASLLLFLCGVLPFIVPAMFGARPLEAGPFRDRIEEFSRREGFR
jgi:hypothetical protein